MGSLPRPWSSASRLNLRRFPVWPLRSCCQKRGYSPHGLQPLHRAPGLIARFDPHRTPAGHAVDQTSSHEILSSLQRSQLKASTFSLLTLADRRKRPPTPVLSAAGLPHPLRSILAVSHDLDGLLRFVPCRRLRRLTLLGFSHPSGTSRPAEDDAVTSSVFHLMAFLVSPPTDSGEPEGSWLTLRLQGLARRVDRRRQFPVSRLLGLDPSWASSCRTASLPCHRLPGFRGRCSPVTRPNCQREIGRAHV